MKKLLLFSLLALGITTNAQTVLFTEDFENINNNELGDWQISYIGTSGSGTFNSFLVKSDCSNKLISGTKSLQVVGINPDNTVSCDYVSLTTSTNTIKPLVYHKIDGTLYKDMKLSYTWKCQGENQYDYGQLLYSLDGTTWSSLTFNLRSNIAPYQTIVTDYSLPAAVNYKSFYIGWRFHANAAVINQPGFTVDDISIKGTKLTGVPGCGNFTNLSNGATINAGSYTFNLSAVSDATSYKLTMGTTSGGSDLYNNTVTTLYSPELFLPSNTILYAKLIPINNVGEANGCSEISFTTNDTFSYCNATTTSTNTSYERISRVRFSDIDNTSNETTQSSGVGYENFTAIVGKVTAGNPYPITVDIANFANDQTIVWIDYNQNGTFEDDEKTNLTSAAIAIGTVNIPTSAKLGKTRMRIRTAASVPLACGTVGYGQVEDYTIDILSENLSMSNINAKDISIYPNPFTDILKISYIKDIESISVMDSAGRYIKSFIPSSEINLSFLKSGLYIINLKMQDGTNKTFKTLKK